MLSASRMAIASAMRFGVTPCKCSTNLTPVELIWEDATGKYCIRCRNCGLHTGIHDTTEDAIKALEALQLIS